MFTFIKFSFSLPILMVNSNFGWKELKSFIIYHNLSKWKLQSQYHLHIWSRKKCSSLPDLGSKGQQQLGYIEISKFYLQIQLLKEKKVKSKIIFKALINLSLQLLQLTKIEFYHLKKLSTAKSIKIFDIYKLLRCWIEDLSMRALSKVHYCYYFLYLHLLRMAQNWAILVQHIVHEINVRN